MLCFVSVFLMRENLKGLRENFKQKIQTYFEDATLKFELAASLNATLVVPGNGCSGI